MSKQDILDVLEVVLHGLQTNKKYVTLERLAKAEQILNEWGYKPQVRDVLMGTFGISNDQLEDYLEVVLDVIKTERKIISLTPKLTQGINNLQNRPVILGMLAALI